MNKKQIIIQWLCLIVFLLVSALLAVKMALGMISFWAVINLLVLVYLSVLYLHKVKGCYKSAGK
jgi:uncharacterized membrane protein YoaK (UPF0700 family)